jgi:hypothetical protein
MLDFPEQVVVGFVKRESGQIIAFRNNGEEGLFASRENSPLRWIKVNDFIPDPKSVMTADDAREEEDEDGNA